MPFKFAPAMKPNVASEWISFIVAKRLNLQAF